MNLPVGQIEWLVDRMSVSRTNEEVEAEVRRRCSGDGWTPSLTSAAVRVATKRHAENRATYQYVTGGMHE